MISKTIQKKICSGQIILYRRASTKAQVTTSYRDQLNTIKANYPDFSIVRSTSDNLTEVMSGRADAEIRFASGLGNALRKLKRQPHTILLVSEPNRIARRADVFELIKAQGLGHRIYDATTGSCLNEIIKRGSHTAIEKQTKAQRASRIRGMVRLMNAGGSIGNDGIANQSALGSSTKKVSARQREEEVLFVVAHLTHQNRGRTPSYEEICEELDRREIRTGQGKFFTPERLAQLRKKNRKNWIRPFDSYHRHRRFIRRVVNTTAIEQRKRRHRKRHMMLLLLTTAYNSMWANIDHPRWDNPISRRNHPHKQHSMTDCDGGCRGPPVDLSTACAEQMRS
jgi:hypothetical protein